MASEQQWITDPKYILYNLIERISILRSEGKGAHESLWLLQEMLAHLTPYDDHYLEVMNKIKEDMKKDKNQDNAFYKSFRACIRLMAKTGIWVEEHVYEAPLKQEESDR